MRLRAGLAARVGVRAGRAAGVSLRSLPRGCPMRLLPALCGGWKSSSRAGWSELAYEEELREELRESPTLGELSVEATCGSDGGHEGGAVMARPHRIKRRSMRAAQETR